MQMTIGCLGRARHGKGTVAQLLHTWFTSRGISAQIIAFADPLKDFLTLLVGRSEPFRGDDAQRNAPIPELTWKDIAFDIYMKAFKLWGVNQDASPTGRQLMQLFGTEVIREGFCRSAWVRMAGSRAKAFDGVTLIDDMRFDNEARKKIDGGIIDVVLKTVRPGLPLLDHPSETAVDNVPLGWISNVFMNDAGLPELTNKVFQYADQTWGALCSPVAR